MHVLDADLLLPSPSICSPSTGSASKGGSEILKKKIHMGGKKYTWGKEVKFKERKIRK